MAEYDPGRIEKKWQAYWDKHDTFAVDRPKGKKFYCLDMFPYPSGSGLHIGHPLGYTATDIYSRFKRMRGFSVLHPMGFDAFGLPAEQHAMATGEHPAIITEKNCAVFRQQMKALGLSFDWRREIATCREEYYRWTQWIFLKLYNSWFDHERQRARPIGDLPIPAEIADQGPQAVEMYRAEHRLAYYADAYVNWCPGLGTVLANEEVIDGKSERGGFDVVRRPMKQWMLRITDYAERLLRDLDEINWPENIKEQQRNWIGRTEGIEIDFKIERKSQFITVFTTRPDTIFGVTFVVVSPEHPLVEVLATPDHRERVRRYCAEAARQSEFTRGMENRKKTGVFTGTYVINPINREPVPVYIGDYVLMSYGTGAVMGVPSHDERDFDFARTFEIEIRPVIIPVGEGEEILQAVIDGEVPWTRPGKMLPNESMVSRRLGLTGRQSPEAAKLITQWLEKQGLGRVVVNYKLRDWLFSRQRYWGEPIPVIHWEDGTMTALAESELPLRLPQIDDYKPGEGGESPLSKVEDWLWVTDPKTGKRGRRETNTMPQWAGSCWYYLRFIDPENKKRPWDSELEQQWMPVDLYVGGAEHAVLHLLYARFWHKVLHDLGHVAGNEPFQRLFNQGMILAYAYKNRRGALVPVDEVEENDDGSARHAKSGEPLDRIVAKMSKSLRNVINPDDVIAKYGADTLRTYLMFMGPLDSSRVWDAKAIMGNYRFLKKVWAFFTCNQDKGLREVVPPGQEGREVTRALHLCIKRITEDLEALRFNTAISSMMEFINTVSGKGVSKNTLERFVLLLAPFAPHLAEELWERLGHKKTLAHEPWPLYDQLLLEEEQVSVVIQVNGRKRALLEARASVSEDELKELVINKMAGSSYQVTEGDHFITVFQPGTNIPKLVNVITMSARTSPPA